MILKRLFDFILAFFVILLFGFIIIICVGIASFDTKSFGLFVQKRIGQFGKPFQIYKIKTVNDKTKAVSAFGQFLRNTKLDELPQLINILNGTMSFVGPRPDVAGYADKLIGEDAIILQLRPGVTGPASIKYRNEEQILAAQQNPLHYNDTVIWPDKVRINKWYVQNRTFVMDIKILFYTIFPNKFNCDEFIKTNNL